MCRKHLSSPRCRSELIDSAWVVIVPGQKCIKKIEEKNTAALSTRMLALELMRNNDFQYILTYKCSQDHLELLFACIRGKTKNDFNNNPDLRTFKAALKRILLRTSTIASKHANCIIFEEQAPNPIFSLKWTKKRTPLNDQAKKSKMSEDNCIEDLAIITYLSSLSPYKSYTIGGYIIRKISTGLSFETCYNAMISTKGTVSFDHYLIFVKDRGGLLYPSEGVLKILKTCEMVFKTVVSGDSFQNTKILQKSNLKLKLKIKVLRTLPAGLFGHFPCDFNNEMVTEDRHSHQLTKEIIDRFVKIRLWPIFHRNVQKGKSGIRQKLNKSVLFQGL